VRALYFGLLRDAVRRWNGFEVETAGDSLFAVFASAADAVQFAVDAQLSIARQTWPSEVGDNSGAYRHAHWRTVSWAATATVSRIAARRQIERRVSLPLPTAVRYCSVKRRAMRSKRRATGKCRHTSRSLVVDSTCLRGVGAEHLFQACHAELPCDFALPADESQTPHSKDADLSPDLAALLKKTDTDTNR
jgi:hypothetical protein